MKGNIVVLDANKNMRTAVKNFLSADEDLQVFDFEDASVCLNFLKTKPIDVLIMDLILPNTDGYVFLAKLKDSKLDKMPKIIVLSALMSDQFVLKAISMGADYYMVKPCDLSLLKQRVLEFMKEDFAVATQNNTERLNAVQPSSNKRMEERIANIFITVGIPAHIKGYQFLREAIKIVMEQPEIINSITKKLYPSIAQRFDTTASKVERSIRHAIEVAWNKGKIENINGLFGLKIYANSEKPTNGEFIVLVADKMLLESSN